MTADALKCICAYVSFLHRPESRYMTSISYSKNKLDFDDHNTDPDL